ncbi:MAG: hypothetical protein ACYDGR_11920 [Candidatus Dormibacteria bacterium]
MLFGLDPLVALLMALIQRVEVDAQAAFGGVVERYILFTGNFAGGGRFIDNYALRALYATTRTMAISMLGAIIAYSCMHAMFERGFRARYTLKVILPRTMLVIALIQGGLFLVQALVDLDNALVHELWWTPQGGGSASHLTLWSQFVLFSTPGNLVLAIFELVTVVVLVVLGVTSVARNLVLIILAAAAPLAFLCMVLPETRTYALAWRRLLLSTIFAQAAQVLVLRLALMLSFGNDTMVGAIHGLVALLLVLKIPTALHAASKAESKLAMYTRHAEHALEKGIEHAVHPPAHSRTRAHAEA